MLLENIDIRQPRKCDPIGDEACEANLLEVRVRAFCNAWSVYAIREKVCTGLEI